MKRKSTNVQRQGKVKISRSPSAVEIDPQLAWLSMCLLLFRCTKKRSSKIKTSGGYDALFASCVLFETLPNSQQTNCVRFETLMTLEVMKKKTQIDNRTKSYSPFPYALWKSLCSSSSLLFFLLLPGNDDQKLKSTDCVGVWLVLLNIGEMARGLRFTDVLLPPFRPDIQGIHVRPLLVRKIMTWRGILPLE